MFQKIGKFQANTLPILSKWLTIHTLENYDSKVSHLRFGYLEEKGILSCKIERKLTESKIGFD